MGHLRHLDSKNLELAGIADSIKDIYEQAEKLIGNIGKV